jgi:thiol:disulfide interchange protein DsbD
VAGLLKEFVTVQLYTDRVPIKSITAEQRKALAEKNQELQFKLTQDVTNPFYVVLTPNGDLVDVMGGYNEPDVFIKFLTTMLGKARDTTKMAQSAESK